MKKILLFIITSFLLTSCSSTKKAEELINTGNYDKAIATSLGKLRKNKHKKGNQKHIILLENAFKKAVAKNKEQISFLKKDNNPENYKRIYELYSLLNKRQYKIKPLLPLTIRESNRNAYFLIEDYQNQLVNSKRNVVEYLYQKSSSLLKEAKISKMEIRKVYENLAYVNRLEPNFKNVNSLLKQAHFEGTDFVLVSIKNETRQVIPKRLESELLQFDTYGLDDFWTVYHNQEDRKINYDYGMELNFRNITISPERVRERSYVKEKEIKEKTIIKDSLGNNKEIYKRKNVSCELYEIKQLKTCDIDGKVNYIRYRNNQILESFPIKSGFVFEHAYATYKGDRRALDKSFIDMINAREIPFPSNEQMIYDTGKDLKKKLKHIITRSRKYN